VCSFLKTIRTFSLRDYKSKTQYIDTEPHGEVHPPLLCVHVWREHQPVNPLRPIHSCSLVPEATFSLSCCPNEAGSPLSTLARNKNECTLEPSFALVTAHPAHSVSFVGIVCGGAAYDIITQSPRWTFIQRSPAWDMVTRRARFESITAFLLPTLGMGKKTTRSITTKKHRSPKTTVSTNSSGTRLLSLRFTSLLTVITCSRGAWRCAPFTFTTQWCLGCNSSFCPPSLPRPAKTGSIGHLARDYQGEGVYPAPWCWHLFHCIQSARLFHMVPLPVC